MSFQSSTIIPRWYQLDAIDAVYNYFMNKSGNPLIGLPCGTGKSALPAFFIKKALNIWPDQRFMLMTSVSELIKQNANVMHHVWPEAPLGIFSAGLNSKQFNLPIIYAGIQSAIKCPAMFGHRDLCWVDEAQFISQNENSMYLRFFSKLREINPNLKIVGMSGTLFRMGQGLLTDNGLFTDTIYDMTNVDGFNRLLAEGYLCPLIPHKTKIELDVTNVGVQNNEYIGSQLQKAVDKDEITKAALKEAVTIGNFDNRKSWLIFASGIEHSNHIAEILYSLGVECASVHSKQHQEYNNNAIKAFKNNELRAISSYSKLAVGFDHPPVDFIIDLRPTLSIVLHVQKYCRGIRPALGKKNCKVLDFSKNTIRLGFVNDPMIPKKKGNKEGDLPVKICDNCGTYNHLRVQYCDNCGHEFKFQVKITAKAANTEIIKSNGMPVVEIFEVDRAMYLRRSKEGKPPYIQVTYFCGMQSFNEFVFPEHSNYAKQKFKSWWQQRHNIECPQTVTDAMKHIHELRTPKTIKVWCNRRYPEILSSEF